MNNEDLLLLLGMMECCKGGGGHPCDPEGDPSFCDRPLRRKMGRINRVELQRARDYARAPAYAPYPLADYYG